MRYYEISPLKIVRSGVNFFTYASEEKLQIGDLVEIPIGKKTGFGVVWNEVKKPEFETKLILRKFEQTEIPERILKTASWMSEYYQTPLAQVLSGILPSGIQKNRRKTLAKKSEVLFKKQIENRTNFLFTNQQTEAIKNLDKTKKGTVLLHGITGSGKTEVYINQAKKAISKDKSVIILVPEIALTSQIVKNFSAAFSNIKLVHSKLTEANRHKIWLDILEDEMPQIIIGARSALFSPVRNLGLIIIDECHEPSFKQEQTPKYSALRTASFMANSLEIKAIFGSATPLVEDYYLADFIEKSGGNKIIKMTELAKKSAHPPEISLVDLTKKSNLSTHRFFSNRLLREMKKTLAEEKQVLIYHNRRGSASITMCHNCGWMAMCENCFIPMTLHIDQHILSCHICGKKDKIPHSCPDCGEAEIIHKGIGTKMIEMELRNLFPDKNIVRFDADSEKEKTVEKLYEQIVSGEIDIIIGTQVIAKGLDLPKLKTVGIIQADSGLSLPDFISPERNFQLLTQVIGRVGRHANDTNVTIQAYKPDSPSINYALTQNYADFYKNEIIIRKNTNFPPFVYLLKLVCVYKTEKSCIKNSREEAAKIRKEFSQDVQILGPTPAFYERIGENYYWQITIKSKSRASLQKIAQEFSQKAHWRTDLDPPSLI